MRREELLITGALLAVIAVGGYFHFTAKERHVDPVVVNAAAPEASHGSAPQPRPLVSPIPSSPSVDINTATRDDLMRVRGIGESLASAIVEYRERQGPFRTMEDLHDVPGIGDARLKLLKERFSVVGDIVLQVVATPFATPVAAPKKLIASDMTNPVIPAKTLLPSRVIININSATVSEIEVALPDIGPVLAGRIVAWRSEHGPFQTVDALEQINGIGPKRLESIRSFIKLTD